MFRQIHLLMRITACNTLGYNEYRYTTDRKKRRRWWALACTWGVLILILEAYVLGLCAGLTALNMGSLIPEYLFTVTSFVIMLFTFFKASSVLFQKKNLQTLFSLPISRTSIVLSRFFTMYLSNLVIGMLVLLPGILWYGIAEKAGTGYFLLSIVCLLFLPLLPMTLASAAGAAITAVSARMKHKSIIAAGLSIALVILVLVVSMMSGNMEGLNKPLMQDLAGSLMVQIRRIYPPAAWYGNACINKDIGALTSFLSLSAVIFILLLWIVQHWYAAICSMLFAVPAKSAYHENKIHRASPLYALWIRELRRYFASSIYISNTLTGYILMAAAAATLLILGTERMDSMLAMPGLTAKLTPFALGFIASIMPTTACAISMEGKQFWIVKTLPLHSHEILASKIMVNLSVAAIPYLLSIILAAIALHPSFPQLVILILIPAVYILFSSTAGLAINLAIPVLNWDSELRVVKQSASTAFAMLTALASTLIPVAVIFACPKIPYWLIPISVVLILFAISAFLFCRSSRRNLTRIN